MVSERSSEERSRFQHRVWSLESEVEALKAQLAEKDMQVEKMQFSSTPSANKPVIPPPFGSQPAAQALPQPPSSQKRGGASLSAADARVQRSYQALSHFGRKQGHRGSTDNSNNKQQQQRQQHSAALQLGANSSTGANLGFADQPGPGEDEFPLSTLAPGDDAPDAYEQQGATARTADSFSPPSCFDGSIMWNTSSMRSILAAVQARACELTLAQQAVVYIQGRDGKDKLLCYTPVEAADDSGKAVDGSSGNSSSGTPRRPAAGNNTHRVTPRSLAEGEAAFQEADCIELRPYSGVVSTVMATGVAQKIDDTLMCREFDDSLDHFTDFHTRALLCVPIRNKDGSIYGALEVHNKVTSDASGAAADAEADGVVQPGGASAFFDSDLMALTALAAEAAPCFHIANSNEQACRQLSQSKAVLGWTMDLEACAEMGELCVATRKHAPGIFRCNYASLYLRDHAGSTEAGRAWTVGTTGSQVFVRLPATAQHETAKSLGILKRAFLTGKTVRSSHVYQDLGIEEGSDTQLECVELRKPMPGHPDHDLIDDLAALAVPISKPGSPEKVDGVLLLVRFIPKVTSTIPGARQPTVAIARPIVFRAFGEADVQCCRGMGAHVGQALTNFHESQTAHIKQRQIASIYRSLEVNDAMRNIRDVLLSVLKVDHCTVYVLRKDCSSTLAGDRYGDSPDHGVCQYCVESQEEVLCNNPETEMRFQASKGTAKLVASGHDYSAGGGMGGSDGNDSHCLFKVAGIPCPCRKYVGSGEALCETCGHGCLHHSGHDERRRSKLTSDRMEAKAAVGAAKFVKKEGAYAPPSMGAFDFALKSTSKKEQERALAEKEAAEKALASKHAAVQSDRAFNKLISDSNDAQSAIEMVPTVGIDMQRNYLCVPIFSHSSIVGAIEVTNKWRDNHKPADFGSRDLNLLRNLGHHVNLALQNIEEHREAIANKKQFASLLNISGTMLGEMDLLILLDSITKHAQKLLRADRATLYLVDKNELWSAAATGTKQIRFPLNKGIAGYVATSGKMVNIPDCYNDKLFNPAMDKATGYKTNSMLALPVYSKAQEKIIGVLQVINKLPERFSKMGAQDASMQANKPVFTKVDEDSSYLLVSQIAVSVENCNKLSKLLTIKEMTEGRKRQAGRGRTGHSTIADDAAVQKMVKGPSSASPGPSALQSADSDAAAVESFREANPFLPKPMPRECTAMIDKDGHMEVFHGDLCHLLKCNYRKMRTTTYEKWLEPLGAEIIAAVEACMVDGKVKMTQNYRTSISLDSYVMDFCVYPAFMNEDAGDAGGGAAKPRAAPPPGMAKFKAMILENEAKSSNHSVLLAISNLFRVYNRVTTIGLSNPFFLQDATAKAQLNHKSLGSNVSVVYIFNPAFKHYEGEGVSQAMKDGDFDDFQGGAFDAFQKFSKIVLASFVQPKAVQHGGVVYRCDNDGIIIVFGLPVAKDSNKNEAALFALELWQDLHDIHHDPYGATPEDLEDMKWCRGFCHEQTAKISIAVTEVGSHLAPAQDNGRTVDQLEYTIEEAGITSARLLAQRLGPSVGVRVCCDATTHEWLDTYTQIEMQPADYVRPYGGKNPTWIYSLSAKSQLLLDDWHPKIHHIILAYKNAIMWYKRQKWQLAHDELVKILQDTDKILHINALTAEAHRFNLLGLNKELYTVMYHRCLHLSKYGGDLEEGEYFVWSEKYGDVELETNGPPGADGER